jgi:hypothetical protein
MNPQQLQDLTNQHIDGIRRLGRPAPAGISTDFARHRAAIRHRAGWALVGIGLRLAGSPDEA